MAVSTGAALAGGALLGSGLLGGGKQAGTVKTKNSGSFDQNQTVTPFQQSYYTDLLSRAQGAVNNPYQGPTLGAPAANQLADTINGRYLNPASNPALSDYVNDALGLVRSNFAGQVGGPAGQNLGNSGYQEMLARTLSNTALPIYANAYSQERQNQLNAAQLAPSVDSANRLSPFSPLLAYQQLISGNYGGTTSASGTSSGTNQQPYFNNPMAGALGGALAGGQIAGMFGGGASPAALLAGGMIPL